MRTPRPKPWAVAVARRTQTSTAARRQADDRRGRARFQGAGHTLGGGGADSNTQGVDARDAAAMAAMQRANNAGGTERDRKMAERRQKDELVGKILAHFRRAARTRRSGCPRPTSEPSGSTSRT